MKHCCALLLGLIALAPAPGGELVLEPPKENGTIDFSHRIQAPGAKCMAVSDTVNLVAIGHRPSKEAARVSLYRLDSRGQPADKPVVLNLPRPVWCKDRITYPVSLAFHPRLSLLYVWQDVEALKEGTPGEDPAYKELDHLLIYNVEGEQPELLVGVARGPEYAVGNLAGAIVFDQQARRLYVPNARIVKPQLTPAVGFLTLDSTGLPVVEDKREDDKIPLDPRKAYAMRTARVAVVQAAVKAGQAPGKYRGTDHNTMLSAWPAGLGFVPVSDDVVLLGGTYGPVTWDEGNRRARIAAIQLHPTYAAYCVDRLAGHPTLPVIFSSLVRTGWIFRMEHADGYLTLVPQHLMLNGAVLHSYPVVLAKRKQVVVGGVNCIHLIALDDKGLFKPERIDVAVKNPEVEALAYSVKFDRLYIAVENLP
jgi:hypothetical protein